MSMMASLTAGGRRRTSTPPASTVRYDYDSSSGSAFGFVNRPGINSTFISSGGVRQTASANTVRLDYNGMSPPQILGVMVEPETTNLILSSSNPTLAPWVAGGITRVAGGGGTGMNGTNSLSTITVSAATAVIGQTVTIPLGSMVTATWWIKPGTGRWIFLTTADVPAYSDAGRVWVDLSTGVTDSSYIVAGNTAIFGTTATARKLANGIVEIKMTSQTAGVTQIEHTASFDTAFGQYTATVGQTYLFDSVMLEVGPAPGTSYVATTTTQVNRGPESLAVAMTNGSYDILVQDADGSEWRNGISISGGFYTVTPRLGQTHVLRVRSYTAGALTSAEKDALGGTSSISLPQSDFNWSVAQPGTMLRASANGTLIDVSGVRRTAAANTLRMDYDGLSPSTFLGVLTEPTATNLALYSADFAGAGWTRFNVSVAGAGGTGMDGTNSLKTVTAVGGLAPAQMIQNISFASGAKLTVTGYVGHGTGRWMYFTMSDTVTYTQRTAVWIDLINDQLHNASYQLAPPAFPAMEPKLRKLSNGLLELKMVVTTVGISQVEFGIAFDGGPGQYSAPAAGTTWKLDSVQFEVGAGGTSYVASAAATAGVRSADTLTVPITTGTYDILVRDTEGGEWRNNVAVTNPYTVTPRTGQTHVLRIASYPVNSLTASQKISLNPPKPATSWLDGYSLVFSDEFDGTSLSRWAPNGTNANPGGTWKTWFGDNNPNDVTSRKIANQATEMIYIDPDFVGQGTTPLGVNPFSVSNGILKITANPAPDWLKPHIWNYNYTSGVIGTPQLGFLYGAFEMRAKLPPGNGMWPAFWLVATNGDWPPEIDILEAVGHKPTETFQTIHGPGPLDEEGDDYRRINGQTGFHSYGCIWTFDKVTWYVDGIETYHLSHDYVRQDMYILINLALGSTAFGNRPVDVTTPFPADYEIDYVRVYQKTSTPQGPQSVVTPLYEFDWTVAQPGTMTRASANGTLINAAGVRQTAAANTLRLDYDGLNPSTFLGVMTEPAATNLALYSADFAGAGWIRSNITVAGAGGTGMDGTNSLKTITATGAAGLAQAVQNISFASGSTITITGYVGHGTGRWMFFSMVETVTYSQRTAVWIDLVNDQLHNNSYQVAPPAFPTMEPKLRKLSNGLLELKMVVPTVGITQVEFGIAFDAGPGQYGAPAAGTTWKLDSVQFEVSPTGTSYVASTAATAGVRSAETLTVPMATGTYDILVRDTEGGEWRNGVSVTNTYTAAPRANQTHILRIASYAPNALTSAQKATLNPAKPATSWLDGYNLVFSDEFDGTSLSRWAPNGTTANPGGTWKTWFGNNDVNDSASRKIASQATEMIYMDPEFPGQGTTPLGIDPFSVSNSILTITANPAPAWLKPHIWNYNYTSGMISLYQRPFLYGAFEIRAKLPPGNGMWPAFWLVPTAVGVWPPEIDILEAVGHQPTYTFHTLHGPGELDSEGDNYKRINQQTGFHTYGCIWTFDKVTFYVDGIETYHLSHNYIRQNMYIIANLALGWDAFGNRPVDATTPFPAKFEIDYIRAYQKP